MLQCGDVGEVHNFPIKKSEVWLCPCPITCVNELKTEPRHVIVKHPLAVPGSLILILLMVQ